MQLFLIELNEFHRLILKQKLTLTITYLNCHSEILTSAGVIYYDSFVVLCFLSLASLISVNLHHDILSCIDIQCVQKKSATLPVCKVH